MKTSSSSSASPTVSFFFISIILCFIHSCNFSNATCNVYDNVGCNQTSNFVGSVRSVIEASHQAMSTIITELRIDRPTSYNDEFELSNAVHDCIELLDDSIDHLHLSINDTIGLQCKGTSTPCTSISVALTNHEQCMEGLDIKTENPSIKNRVIQVVSPLQSMMAQLLTMVNPETTPQNKHNNNNNIVINNRQSLDQLINFQMHEANATVALDGSGQYTRIMDAIKAAPENSEQRFVIYIKKGVYKEKVSILKHHTNLVMIGESQNETIITGNRSYTSGYKTYHTATVVVAGCGFMASNITFQNTAGPEGGQAVAMRSNAENLVFYRCTFKAYQDTLYARYGRQFFRECDIMGTVDFIFGDATAVFQRCNVLVRKPMSRQFNTITAQGRQVGCSDSGFSFHDCNFTNAEVLEETRTYLGRPWRNHSRTVVMESVLGELIDREGWADWDGRLGMETVYYGEYNNSGPGANVTGRVKLAGVHVIVNETEALNFTVGRFIDGDEWLPSTGVNYTTGFNI